MTGNELTLHLHDYSLFPYERDLAGREVTALVGKHFKAAENTFTVLPKWKSENLWRLTYFSRSVNGIVSCETLQHSLERSHYAAKGRNHRRQSTRYSVHGLHEYKGKFNPQVAHALLNIFGADARQRILDPFCGSGTSLVEAAHLGIPGTGFDMNPLAVFIANTKLAALSCDPVQLRKSLKRVATAVNRIRKSSAQNSSRHEYLSKWFTPEILTTLESLRLELLKEAEPVQNFLLTAASNLLRDYSLQDPGDLRIRRRQTPLPTKPFIEAWLEFAHEQIAVIEAVQPLLPCAPTASKSILADSRERSSIDELNASFDHVITSPPYATALPYIDTQRLSLVWLGLINPDEIRKLEAGVLGSREILRERQEMEDSLHNNVSGLPDAAAKFCLKLANSLGEGDGFRRMAVPILLYRYLAGMKQTFTNLHQLLRKGGRMGWVVGVNQTTLGGKSFVIDTPGLLECVAEQAGFHVQEPIKLQAYQRYGVHKKNSIREESVIMFRR